MPDPIAWDFSGTKPTVAQFRAAGVSRCIAYLANDWRGINRTQLKTYLDAGIEVAFVYEHGRGDNLDLGYDEGVRCAKIARALADGIGQDLIPLGTPIYFADDVNDPYSGAVWSAIQQFALGADSVLGAAGLAGIYAEADVLNNIVRRLRWETGASSYSDYRHCAGAVLRQLGNRVSNITAGLASNAVDDNLVLATDWGQTPRPSSNPSEQPEDDDMPEYKDWSQASKDAFWQDFAKYLGENDVSTNLKTGKALGVHMGDPTQLSIRHELDRVYNGVAALVNHEGADIEPPLPTIPKVMS